MWSCMILSFLISLSCRYVKIHSALIHLSGSSSTMLSKALAIVIKKVEKKNTKQTAKPYVQRLVLIMIETNKQIYIKIFNTLITLLIRMEGKYCSICLGKSHERSCSEKASFQANLNNGKTRTWRFTARQGSSLLTYLQWAVTGTHRVEASYS